MAIKAFYCCQQFINKNLLSLIAERSITALAQLGSENKDRFGRRQKH
jgi:hypothetical protein